jgi:hypothetical protein
MKLERKEVCRISDIALAWDESMVRIRNKWRLISIEAGIWINGTGQSMDRDSIDIASDVENWSGAHCINIRDREF